MGSNRTPSPSASVSPIANTPGFASPTTSPANATSTDSRSDANSFIARVSRTSLPVRTLRTVMSRSNLPLHTRRNAMRSRWRGSMLAWILNTKPLNRSSVGSTTCRSASTRGAGGGPIRTNASRNSSTPKFVTALPKNTGVTSPRSIASRSNAEPAPSSNSSWSMNSR